MNGDGDPDWLNLRTGDHLHMVELIAVHDDRRGARRTAGCEVVMAHGRDADGAVDVGDIDHIDIHVSSLHVNDPSLSDVGDVDLVDVAGAGVIPGVVRLART